MGESLRILVVDDELIVRESLAGWLNRAGYEVNTAQGGLEALEMMGSGGYDLVFLDIRMPDINGMQVLKTIKLNHPATLVVMITAYSSVETAIEAMKSGADDYLVKPFEPDSLQLLTEKLMNQKRLLDENICLRRQIDGSTRYLDLIGSSACMKRVFSFIEQVAGVDSPVLLQGETGTGKELVAKAIHARSNRRHGPFVTINCGAFAESLLESELFGHEVGSFTGAVRTQKGRLEMAHGGTLFLDEIGEIPPKMQVDMLRVLQEKRFHRVGGRRDLHVDFRLISATHRNLRKRVAAEKFRQDFYFRLKVIEIEIPPLRERADDIPLLALHFLHRFRRETGKDVQNIRDDALALLQSYPWPGNVRELENVIERAVVLAKTTQLGKRDFGFLFRNDDTDTEDVPISMKDMEKNHIHKTLKLVHWNISKAATLLEINRVTLHNKIKRYGLKPSD